MNKIYLILDTPYLCHRAKYVFGDLSYAGSATGIIYGLLKDILHFQGIFDTKNIIFCWDSKTSKREKVYPEYKAHRKNKYIDLSQDEIKFESAFRKQIKKLRTEYLPMIGYKNIFFQEGYESDDIIASICSKLSKQEQAIIITSDKDLYQLISSNISIYNPQKHKRITLQSFYKEYGFLPNQWAKVKSIAGCYTDNIKGIQGVGEKTAIKYVKNILKSDTQAYTQIILNHKIIERNLPLIQLPFEGTNIFELKEDEFSRKGWKQVCNLLGMESIKDKG